MPFELDKILAFCTGAGFATFVAVWHMLKTDKIVESNTKALNELTSVLGALLRRDGVSLRVGVRGDSPERGA